MHTAMRYLWHMRTASISDELNDRVSEVRATVAANLDAALKAQRWSRRAAAVALGLSHRYVNDRAAGEVELSATDLALFSDFLNVPVARFFETNDEGSVTVVTDPSVPPARFELATSGTNVRRFPLERTRRAGDRDHGTMRPIVAIGGAR